MLIPFSIASYKRSDLPPVVLRNQFVEKTSDTPEQLVLFPRPGLTRYQSLGIGPIRGMFQASGAVGGALFTVSGASLYNASTAIGGIDGSASVQMAATLNTLLIATGASLQSSDGATVSTIAFPNGYGASSVANLGGYTLASATGTRRIYFTLDPSTWDALDYISTTATTANIVGFAQLSDQLWVFTEDRTYVFVLTGNSAAPIQAVPGRVFPRGCRSRDSIVIADNTIFWVGDDGIVYRADNAPLRVSDHGIEEMITESAAADLACWTYTWIGHTMVVLHMTGGTRVYDASTQQWHEAASYGRARWRARMGLFLDQNIIVGDDETGQLWKLDASATSDDGTPLDRTFTIIIQSRGFLDRLTLDCTTGATGGADQPAGIIELRTSRDSGDTWSNWRQASLGVEGQYRAWPAWRSLGMVDEESMVIQIRLSDPRPWRMSNPRVNDAAAGRSR